MAPLLPRLQVFEFDDSPYFPAFLRSRIQDGLSVVWSTRLPMQRQAPADIAAATLIRFFGDCLSTSTFVDFCAGGGGPTPRIEQLVNEHQRTCGHDVVSFVLTDIQPNIESWDIAAAQSAHITYDPQSVDATRAPARLISRADGKAVVRLFSLAFHHFDDGLARAILKDTVENSEGFVIFELQDRTLRSFLSITMLFIGTILGAPFFAWKRRSPATLFFSWVIPILPFVLTWDGWMSALRTRTPTEVEALLRSCGADSTRWEVHSGEKMILWPFSYMNYIICRPTDRGLEKQYYAD